MEETFFKRVSVKEELPEKCNNATFSEWVVVYSYETCLGEAMYDFENQCWQLENNALHDKITDWLKPFSLSRDNMIEVLKETELPMFGDDTWTIPQSWAELIADAILKSGLLEKKVEIKKSDFKQYSCPNCASVVDSWDKYCHECAAKITWIS